VAARKPIAMVAVAVVTAAEAATADGRRGRPNMTTRWGATMVGASSTPVPTGLVHETKGRPDVLRTGPVTALRVAQRGAVMLVRAAITTTVWGSLLRAAPVRVVMAVPANTARVGLGRVVMAVPVNTARADPGRVVAARANRMRADMGRAMAGGRVSPVKAGRDGRAKAVRVGVLTSGRRRAVTLVRAARETLVKCAPVTLVRGARMTAVRAGSPGANRADTPVTGRPGAMTGPSGAMTGPTSAGVTGAG
jgi:hypothetical protein